MTHPRRFQRCARKTAQVVIAATTLAAALTGGLAISAQETAAAAPSPADGAFTPETGSARTTLAPMACRQGRVVDLSGSSLIQDNGATVIIDSWVISTQATPSSRWVSGRAHSGGGTGNLFGTTSNTGVDFVITWSATSAGMYAGTLDRNNSLSGSTFDIHTPSSRAHWNADGVARCV
jgi:hypothetical protein